MKLRGRLALLVLATTVPLVAGAAAVMSGFWDHMAARHLQEHASFRMEHGGRDECERDPASFALPRTRHDGADPDAGAPQEPLRNHAAHVLLSAAQRAEIYAYAADFVSANPAAPGFPPRLRAALEGGASAADEITDDDGGRVLSVGVRMPWSGGPCVLVLARQEVRPDLRALHDLVVGSALVGIGLVVAVLLAAGPPVARIRALAAGVRRAAAERWTRPVDVQGSDEIADLARAFNAAGAEVRAHLDALERRERTLREFVANTDHDLTIPLTVLLGQLSELERRANAGEPADAARVGEAAKEADYMASLVRNLGVAARLEAGEPELAKAPVDLNALVERVVARHRPAASSGGVSLEFAVPEETVRVLGDETLLEQAASNLVHNAVRHNRPGGHVAVTLEAPRDPAGTFVLRVADDGPGVSGEELARLGDRGHRGAAARQRHGGEGGLGLHIVKRVVERHEMRLDLRARDGGGLVAEIGGTRG